MTAPHAPTSEAHAIPFDAVAPDVGPTLAVQGMPEGRAIPERIRVLFEDAREVLSRIARPAGMHASIDADAFDRVLEGEGRNESRMPVQDVHAKARERAVFAVTLGHDVDREIRRRFETNDAAMGAMLDAAASIAADRAADVVQSRFASELKAQGDAAAAEGVLRYSPGYCGWHVSGQRRLLAALDPRPIGIALRESFLMDPLKSVSGVLLAGPREIHAFADTYPCCEPCETHACRGRLKELFGRRR